VSADPSETRAVATAVFHDAAMSRWFIVTQQDWPAAAEPEPVELVWGCLVNSLTGTHEFQFLDYRNLATAWARLEGFVPCPAGPLVRLLRREPMGRAGSH
jgi:hypothetical protein